MLKRKAIHYGQIELISGVACDGYILDDGSTAMSERGTANLLNMDVAALNRVLTKGIPKNLKPFISEELSVLTNIEVTASNSPIKEEI